MNKVLRLAVGLPAVLFVLIGIGWLAAPAVVGGQFKMELLTGKGLSTQIGDLASFFLTLGSCILLGLRTGNKVWFYPAIMLLGFTAVGRTLAWLVHGAALAVDMIAVEVIVAGLLFYLTKQLPKE